MTRFRYTFYLFLFLSVGCRWGGEETQNNDSGATLPPAVKPQNVPVTDSSSDPAQILGQMVTAYKTAVTYSDSGTVSVIGKTAEGLGKLAAAALVRHCRTAYNKPEKIYIEVNHGLFLCGGKECFARIKELPRQVRYFPLPEAASQQWTLETLFQDALLDAAMETGVPRTVLRFPPQLILLFANNPLNTFCPKDAEITMLEPQNIGGHPCDVIQIAHSSGNRTLYIDCESRALRRFDCQPFGMLVPEGFENVEAIRIELTDAQFNGTIPAETFRREAPPQTERVAAFQAELPKGITQESHLAQLKTMTETDCYRQMGDETGTRKHGREETKEQAPKIFTLTPLWSQPLNGAGAVSLLAGKEPKLLTACEGNMIAVLDVHGKLLQKFQPEGIGDSEVIMNIKTEDASRLDGRKPPAFGVQTLSGSALYVFDASFKPVLTYKPAATAGKKATIADFQFLYRGEEELLLLGIGQMDEGENPETKPTGLLRAVDFTGATKVPNVKQPPSATTTEGVPDQIEYAFWEEMHFLLTKNNTAAQGGVVVWNPLTGERVRTLHAAAGWQVLWFGAEKGVLFTLQSNLTAGQTRFAGLDAEGKEQWGCLLPAGQYEVPPLYLPQERCWLIASSTGTILVFDMLGNKIDTFSLGTVPEEMFCLQSGGRTLLIISDGKTLSARSVSRSAERSGESPEKQP